MNILGEEDFVHCFECVFSQPINETGADGLYYCRRWPPAYTRKAGFNRFEFPITSTLGWCGEGRAPDAITPIEGEGA